MESEKLIDFRLYLITDGKLFADKSLLLTAVEEALKSGVRAVQLRERDITIKELSAMAYKMRELTRKYDAKLFINDRVDIALVAEADGVHLGQNGMPAYAVRRVVQDRLLIGVSAHSVGEAVAAEKDGADFITIGPVYHTPSKLKYGKPVGINTVKKVKSGVAIPAFAIGGIKPDKVNEVIKAGADGVALISAILGSDNIKDKTEEFMRLLK